MTTKIESSLREQAKSGQPKCTRNINLRSLSKEAFCFILKDYTKKILKITGERLQNTSICTYKFYNNFAFKFKF